MDKNWIRESRVIEKYLQGVSDFLDFAFLNAAQEGLILCPCNKCTNRYWEDRETILDHLICDGFSNDYTSWIYHGEDVNLFSSTHNFNNTDVHDDMRGMLNEAFGIFHETAEEMAPQEDMSNEDPNEEAKKFYKLVEDSEQELYPGCKKFSKLSFIVRLFHLKCLNGWTNSSFTMLLTLIKEALPEGETLPNSFYEVKKIINDLGLGYRKIDACPNDCQLYYKETATASSCNICSTSRWKSIDNDVECDSSTSKKKVGKKIPAKVVWHFPLKSRLQRLFMSSKTASLMRWHHEGRTNDGVMRHPADSPAWKTFDFEHPEFSSEPRNVRLGLASDGFNPFRSMSTAHSTWPVILIPYNLPPWMCMKQPFIFLSLLIPGPTAPGNNIDVYLQPLVDELNDLWRDGLNTYDASMKQNFRMHAVLLWTISDFPGYANLSGWSTKGRLACPSCNVDTDSRYLKHGRKFSYMGHRRFLERNHKFRRDRISFDGNQELRDAPVPLSGSKVLQQLQNVENIFGKFDRSGSKGKRKRGKDVNMPHNWKKKSIFFSLPYWENLLIRHNIDVMHVEKNVFDNVHWTLLNVDGRSKDNIKARLDLQVMDIRESLHLKQNGSKTIVPPACFLLSKKEKDVFFKLLKSVKYPNGYAANISKCVHVKDRKIIGLKSHDCHILIQQLLPIALRSVLTKNVSSPLMELSRFFRELCCKSIKGKDLQLLESQITLTLCHLERIFPPAFFDIMVHLTIHLAYEARIAGPVQYRWMYPIERFLHELKSYVRNQSHPEGSIVEGYLAEESLAFCAQYLEGVVSTHNKQGRNYEEELESGSHLLFPLSTKGRPIRHADMFDLDEISWVQAHRYVLFNCDAVSPYRQKHIDIIKGMKRRIRQREIEQIHCDTFHDWFKEHVNKAIDEKNEVFPEEIVSLARGPYKAARRFKGYAVNGFRFHTRDREKNRKTQNSGVVVTASTSSYASAKDKNPVAGDITYYGILTDIIELNYYEHFNVVLFRCDWADVHSQGRGVKRDDYGFTLVNFNRLLFKGYQLCDEPFILASQAKQVFYVQDPIEKDWQVVIHTKPRDLFDMQSKTSLDDMELHFNNDMLENMVNVIENEEVSWIRSDVAGITIDTPIMNTQELRQNACDDAESDDENDLN